MTGSVPAAVCRGRALRDSDASGQHGNDTRDRRTDHEHGAGELDAALGYPSYVEHPEAGANPNFHKDEPRRDFDSEVS